jgi:hypothetical protein
LLQLFFSKSKNMAMRRLAGTTGKTAAAGKPKELTEELLTSLTLTAVDQLMQRSSR